MYFAVALYLDFQAPRQRIGHGDTNAVEPARECVGAFAILLVELAPGMQTRKHDLDGGDLLYRMDADRNAAPVVLDADRLIGVHPNVDTRGGTGQRLIGGVVDNLVDDVRRIAGARVHAGSLADRLQALEHADRRFLVSASCQRSFLSFR